MAKARAIVKRRKAVRNIRKITKTMQMIATAKFQKALKRAVATKPYTRKMSELVHELSASIDVRHPLLRVPGAEDRSNRVALVVITSNRGLAGAYNGSILRAAAAFIREQETAGRTVDLYVSGRKGIGYFSFQKRPIAQRYDLFADQPRFGDVERIAQGFIDEFTAGTLDALHVAYMNFRSTSTQKPEVLMLLPLSGAVEAAEHIERATARSEAQARAGAMDTTRREHPVELEKHEHRKVDYDFSPSAEELLNELLPLTVKTALFQCFLDAVTSENVARMVAMKSATDNADKMVRTLTMQYNRARQTQITTELSEIMGGVESMKG